MIFEHPKLFSFFRSYDLRFVVLLHYSQINTSINDWHDVTRMFGDIDLICTAIADEVTHST